MRIWLLRHAKSSWNDADLADHDRPLASRGRRDAERMRAYLEGEGIRPSLVVCSSGLRARETLAGVIAGLGTDLTVRIDHRLYTFDATAVLEQLRGTPADVGSVMVVGHNPALQDLAGFLTRGPSGNDEVAQRFPTCALAEIELPSMAWSAVGAGTGTLARFVVPRSLR